MISWITIDILSLPRMSTSGRAPWFSAIIRFWIRVESLKRPPTLLTISSSFSSSIMALARSTAVLDQDRGEFLDGPIQVVIDHLYIIMVGQGDLAAGGGQSPGDRGLIVGPSHPQAGLQDLEAGNLDEDQQGVGDLLTDLEASLDIDDQDHTQTLSQRPADRFGRRAVQRAVNDRRLEQVLPDACELFLGEEEVIAAGHLTGPGAAGGGGDRDGQPQLGARQQPPHQGALPGTRWPADDDQPAGGCRSPGLRLVPLIPHFGPARGSFRGSP